MSNEFKMTLTALLIVASANLMAACQEQRPVDADKLAINRGRVIKFEHPLPRMTRPDGKGRCGTYNNLELSFPGVLTTEDSRLGMFMQKMRETIMATRRVFVADGKPVVCCHNWIRDHVQQMKGWKFWEHRPADFLDFIIDHQRSDGQFYELVKQWDDYHWTFVDPDCAVQYPEDHVALVRLELEADVEYLVVEGAWQYYRMTGDDNWLRRRLPALEKGIDYQTSDPKRWESSLGLCIRPYTIDTWDFTYDPESGRNRMIAGKPLCAMHGDNTGVYQAMNQLAWFNERLGNAVKAAAWRERAATLKANIMKHLWNGKFFVHQLPVRGAKELDGRERERLSLSDSYALNRGILSEAECQSVIDEYQARRKTSGAFAEWFTIDPPYTPKFMIYSPGKYVNGAISPFTAGELALGALNHGREKYGWDILSRWVKKIEEDKNIYFLYAPDTGKAVSADSGPSAWGAAALLSAIEEGLAGIHDAGTGYDVIEFSPRWPLTNYLEGRYLTGYELTSKTVDVRWNFTDAGFRYNLRSPAKRVKARLLVPEGKTAKRVLVDGVEQPLVISRTADFAYVEVGAEPKRGEVDFEVLYQQNNTNSQGGKAMEVTLNAANFEAEVIKSDKPVIVDFWATWCGPCRMLAPELEALAAAKGDAIKVGKVNVDENQELCIKYGIESIPAIFVFKNGRITAKSVGYQRQAELAALLDK